METVNSQESSYLREDNQLLMITHLTQLLNFITGFGGLIAPLLLWAFNKEKIHRMDAQGREIVNFQISLFIYSIVSIPLILLIGLGFILLILICIVGIVYPILNAVKATRGEHTSYPFTIKFL